jgi:hypothetical protein
MQVSKRLDTYFQLHIHKIFENFDFWDFFKEKRLVFQQFGDPEKWENLGYSASYLINGA